ncbi:T9SS-dependent M36 family metallopeptidase [Pontibacter sp. SGAir0037]|uniref:T9SS-dependent M36 family metallopeptidase n=1 Tax=Pontibacter sp. SGAir0037 TaxID=2571030 RepID=UPI0010CD0458|nr:T9SS-dependent M36 family metallopeptidase [Pontibacter sp. SGAir0037]QCR23597.1 metalloprotease [Pontibacter sp. SGAir0037]
MKRNLPVLLQLALLMVFLLGSITSYGQGKPDKVKKAVPRAAVEHLKKNKQKLELADEDFAELEVSSTAETKKNGLKHYYLKQLHNGIEIHGAITTVNLDKNDNVVSMGNRFHKEVGKKVKAKQAGLSAEAAVAAAATYLNTPLKEPLTVKERGNGANKEVLFTTGGISLEPIPAKLVYQPMEDGSLRLAWEVSIYEMDAQNWWNLRLDAATGEVLDKDNMVVHCQFDNNGPDGKFLHNDHGHAVLSPYIANSKASNASIAISNAYNVFPMPYESPSHGPRAIVSTSAADPVASPQGWHTETRTRGNNVYAYEDPNNNNSWQNNYSPDGGAELSFDFPIDFTQQPVAYRDAAITNLFYWNNLVHDVWYQYGFDELSGNFQLNNYGRGGAQADPVLAEAQDSRNIATTRNNANFATNVDGFAPRMQMYLWSSPPDENMFRVTSPGDIAAAYPAVQAAFGPRLTPTAVTGKLVLAEAPGNPVEGCGTFTNASAMAGNIAVVYRGSCEFGAKVLNAQQAGAIAVVVINNATGAPISMGAGATNPDLIRIPSLMTTDVAGAAIRAKLDSGQEVTVALKDEGKPELDGDFDNGIIVHEYGHGISNRLTGGPQVANCLNNAEQMGEGWSDWFGLMMTMRVGDTRGKVRGIGTYAQGQPTNGQGIRPAPYSTDFGVNAYTYAATNNTAAISQPHGIGFVWSTMLWDMTWDLIDKYGFDEDIYNGNGGNNMAMQLVIDGLKLQACRPGFVDGRDAILAADRLNYGGANQELIWRAFAKRGLGYSASQGLNTSRTDQVEAFDLPPVYACEAPAIAVKKTSDVYTGGDENTIFLGYGAQSVVLQASGDPTFTYSWSPVAGLSDTTIATPVFTPTKAGTYHFTVTAVNEAGCTRTAAVTISVIDVRDVKGNGNNVKVFICHNGKMQSVGASAVADHLAHGDYLGSCGATYTVSSAATAEGGLLQDAAVTSYPNPFSEDATISFTAQESGFASLKVYDVTGRLVATLFEGNVEAGASYSETFTSGNKKSGVYIYRFVNGNTAKSGSMLLIK